MLSEGVSTPGGGKPVFKVLHADQCREVVRKRLCQMCVEPLPETVVAVNQGQQDCFRPLLSDGLPMCPGCALEAFDACPGMQRQAESGELRLWQTQRGAWLVAPVILGAVPESLDGDEKINRLIATSRKPIFTGPKLVLTHWQLISLADLVRMCDVPGRRAA